MHSAASPLTKRKISKTYLDYNTCRRRTSNYCIVLGGKRMSTGAFEAFGDPFVVCMYLFTTLTHPHGH